jgi:hypothetical protein
MKEYIVSKLVEEYVVSYQEALLFYYQLAERHQLESLIVRIDDFSSFEQLKKYFLGGK